jgi:hypothetical protein
MDGKCSNQDVRHRTLIECILKLNVSDLSKRPISLTHQNVLKFSQGVNRDSQFITRLTAADRQETAVRRKLDY